PRRHGGHPCHPRPRRWRAPAVGAAPGVGCQGTTGAAAAALGRTAGLGAAGQRR
ncbi:unnamed protein product, partial [Prorocentrum cordatum]